MKIHIVGSGPTGMSLAWEILRSGEHDVTLYDKIGRASCRERV